MHALGLSQDLPQPQNTGLRSFESYSDIFPDLVFITHTTLLEHGPLKTDP